MSSNSQILRPSAFEAPVPRREFFKPLVLLALWLASFSILYRDVIAKLIHDWTIDEDYSHGFLIVPLSLYFAWERRQKFSHAIRKPSPLGLVVVLGSLGMLLVGILGAEVFTTEISMIGALTGSVLFLYGWRHLKVMMFPIAFLLLMVPVPSIVFNQIAMPLQFVASGMAERFLMLLHIPVLREGNVIHLANITLEVAEACSGIRSLVSLLTMGIVYGYFMESRTWMRWLLIIATVPVAILANGFRVAATGAAAYRYGSEVAEGFLHAFEGWIVFLVSCLMLLVIHRVSARFFPAKSIRLPLVTAQQTNQENC